MARKLTQEEVIKQFKEKHGDKYGYDKVYYTKNNEKVLIYCKSCKEYFKQQPSNHKRGIGCPYCAGKKICKNNIISTVRPDLIKYFIDKEDANKYTVGSRKIVLLKCPNCNFEKPSSINQLSNRGFSCSNCSGGTSMPERFCIELLLSLNISFTKEKKFEWSQNKRYDFYIESLNMIIETHGIQHYQENNRGLTLQEEQQNDEIKKKLAKENGIENYIVVDCRKSEFNFLQESFIIALGKHFNLSTINWLTIWEKSQNNRAIDIWNAWNNKNEDDTASTIANLFSIDVTTVIRYLKRGNELGICIYNPDQELQKNANRNKIRGEKHAKKVYQFSLNGVFIKEYPSLTEASNQLKISYSGISMCCNGTRKTAGGFKWSFNKELS